MPFSPPPRPSSPGSSPGSSSAPAAATPPGRAARPPRRQVLGALAAAGLALAGCRRGTATGTAAPTTTPAGPDPLLADLADVQRLLSVYDATLRAYPRLAGRLRPLRANHAEHVSALRQAVGDATSTATPAAAAAPGNAAAALSALRAREHAAATALAASAVRAAGGRAALLASIAACSASHEVMLS